MPECQPDTIIMGHHISAVVLRGPFDAKLAACFNLRPIALSDELTLFPLVARYVDSWAERLKIEGSRADEPLLNSEVVHHLIRTIAPDPLFAVIETDYFGGHGTQAAAVYRGEEEVMAPERGRFGTINKALRLLGVKAGEGCDEFDTVGLGQYRDFSGLFDAYYDPPG
jgi:hypothetical protein